jgi:large subunit ribosomal protein L4
MAERTKKTGAGRRAEAAAAAGNPTVPIINANNERVGEASLSPAVFGVALNEHLLYEAVRQQRAGERRGTHMTKNRALVSGSGRKPWRQKGTGRARVGETRNPLWRHGGTVFGPQPRDYSYSIPRKARAAALRSAISLRVSEGALKIVDGLAAETPKTKLLKALLDRVGAKGKALLIEWRPAPALVLSSRNLPGVRVVDPLRLTVYDVLDCRTLLVTREAVGKLEERLTP